MPHERQVIRAKVRQMLLGRTLAAQRVYLNRFVPLRTSELPAVMVFVLSESIEAGGDATAPRELTRIMQLAIDAVVEVEEGADDAMDALALQIESVMHADPTLGGTAGDSILSDTEIGTEPEGDRLVGRVALTYDVTYRTMAPEGPTDLADFLVADVTHDVGGQVHEDEEAHDEVVVQEISP